MFNMVGAFLEDYDVPGQSTEPSVYVYPGKRPRAEDISGILDKVFTGKKTHG
ncbi:MAG: hypothetical protein R2860_07415 [Desulfobacterales bacterium]